MVCLLLTPSWSPQAQHACAGPLPAPALLLLLPDCCFPLTNHSLYELIEQVLSILTPATMQGKIQAKMHLPLLSRRCTRNAHVAAPPPAAA